jgi:hypothetical protein
MNEDHKDIKKFFSDLLNANVTIKDSLYPDNKETFLIVVDKLKSIYDSQVSLLHEKGIDLGDITEDFWFVIDNLFIMFYGEEINNLIQWYITSQKNSKGKVTPWIGEDGKIYEFRNSLDLWEYIQYFIYSKDA